MGRLKLNVLYFGPRGLSGGIGGSARLRNMLDILRKLEISTRLISYLPESRFRVAHEKISAHLNATAISVNNSSPKIFKLFGLLLVFLYGLRHIRGSDVVFSHSPGVVYGFPALILSKLFRKRLIIDLTDICGEDTPEFIYNFVLRHSDVVLAVSEYLMRKACRMGCCAIHLPGFVDTELFRYNRESRERTREELGVEDKIVIGYTGAFSPDEGVDCLLRAFEIIRKTHDVRLVFLGSYVKGEDIISIPPQPYEKVPDYLSAFDIACSPKNDCEVNGAADPIRIYEYMSVGLPVVGSMVGDTSLVSECGFLFYPRDEIDLSNTLRYVIDNFDSLHKRRHKGRERVIEGYSQQVARKKLKVILDDYDILR